MMRGRLSTFFPFSRILELGIGMSCSLGTVDMIAYITIVVLFTGYFTYSNLTLQTNIPWWSWNPFEFNVCQPIVINIETAMLTVVVLNGIIIYESWRKKHPKKENQI